VDSISKLQPTTGAPAWTLRRDFDSLFTVDKPGHIQFPRVSQLIHRLAYRRTNHDNIHVRGYKEKGNINTLWSSPSTTTSTASAWLWICGPRARCKRFGGHAKERFLNQQIECRNYAHQYGIDKRKPNDWTWPY